MNKKHTIITSVLKSDSCGDPKAKVMKIETKLIKWKVFGRLTIVHRVIFFHLYRCRAQQYCGELGSYTNNNVIIIRGRSCYVTVHIKMSRLAVTIVAVMPRWQSHDSHAIAWEDHDLSWHCHLLLQCRDCRGGGDSPTSKFWFRIYDLSRISAFKAFNYMRLSSKMYKHSRECFDTLLAQECGSRAIECVGQIIIRQLNYFI